MPVTYFDPADTSELMQGDVLQRTPELNDILINIHPQYCNAKNLYFMVLTQSCDLVERASGVAKAPYIVVAPVRSVDRVFGKYISDFEQSKINAEVPIIKEKFRNKRMRAWSDCLTITTRIISIWTKRIHRWRQIALRFFVFQLL